MSEDTKELSKSKTPDKPKVRGPSHVMDTMNIFETTEKTRLTVDGFDNFLSKIGLNNNNLLSEGTYTLNLVTRNRLLLEASYRGSWIVGAVVDSVAEDMTRAGVAVTTTKGEKNLKKLKVATARLKIGQSLCNAIKWGRLYGGALAIVQIQGQKLDTPLNLDTIGKDQFRGLVVYDRWQLNPSFDEVIDSGPDMGLPKYYYIVTDMSVASGTSTKAATSQIKVHHSRVIRFTGIDLPYFQAMTEMMWGESVLERLWDRLIAFDNATMSSASLIDRANLRHVGIEGLREVIGAGGEAQAGLAAMFDMVRSMQSNEGFTVFDKNDEFQTTSYTFAGLSDMLLQFSQQVSGAAKIPLTRLFGQSPAGLNATGDADIRMYYDNIAAAQYAELGEGWVMILKIMWRSLFGEAPPDDLDYTFVPLWQMSATDKANIGKSNTETIIGALEADAIDKPTAMKELRQSSTETGLFSNITDEQIKDAEKEKEDNPPIPGEADPEEKPKDDEEKKDEEKKPPVKDSKWKFWR